NYDDTFFDDDD
ncbi:CPXV166 protein, partial [Monkeypox virus]